MIAASVVDVTSLALRMMTPVPLNEVSVVPSVSLDARERSVIDLLVESTVEMLSEADTNRDTYRVDESDVPRESEVDLILRSVVRTNESVVPSASIETRARSVEVRVTTSDVPIVSLEDREKT
jgi:hypothetical protein